MDNTNRVIRTLVLIFILSAIGSHASPAEPLKDLSQAVHKKFDIFEQAVNDMTIIGTGYSNNFGKPSKYRYKIYKKANKYRTELYEFSEGFELSGKPTSISISDDNDSWNVSAASSKKKSSGQSSSVEGMDGWWNSLLVAKALGSEKIEGGECYVAQSGPIKMWIDKKDFVLIKQERQVSKEKIITNRYLDFRLVANTWAMPYKAETFDNGKLISSTVINQIAVNSKIADDLFDPAKLSDSDVNSHVPSIFRKIMSALDGLIERIAMKFL